MKWSNQILKILYGSMICILIGACSFSKMDNVEENKPQSDDSNITYAKDEEISNSISNSLIYREYEIGTEYSAGSIIEINKELLVQEVSTPETILVFYNDEILWEKPFSEEELMIELEKTGYYGFYAKDEKGELYNIGNACMCLKSGSILMPLN